MLRIQGHSSWNLTPGVVDTNALAAFTEEHCWLFAIVANELYDWPIVLLSMLTCKDDNDVRENWQHVCVRLPNHQLFDVYGARDEDVMKQQWRVMSLSEGIPRDDLLNDVAFFYNPTSEEHMANKALVASIVRAATCNLQVAA